jgi:hypothetical protein
MMKFFGGSSSRSYPQTGQRCMSGPHLQLDRKYSKGVCRPPGNFLTIMNVAILPSLANTPNSHVLGSKRTRSPSRVHSKASARSGPVIKASANHSYSSAVVAPNSSPCLTKCL